MKLVVNQSLCGLASAACAQIRESLNQAVAANGSAALLLSTGASQLVLLQTLVDEQAAYPIAWDKIDIFHLDEYIGIPPTHPASFCRYIKERFTDLVKPRSTHYVYGDIYNDRGVAAMLGLMNSLLKDRPIDLGLIGIGENAHIAFNDPPADFMVTDPYIAVALTKTCKMQQVHERWFETIEDVPDQAFTMSVQQILKCRKIISFVPYAVKAEAVAKTISEDTTNLVPATILRTHPDVTLYLDGDSSKMLTPDVIGAYN